MRTLNKEQNERYTKLYINLRNAYKIVGLTGTPIYSDESDLAFIINFVTGQNLIPFNQDEFHLEYTKILPARQFFRGYFSESNLMVATLPPTLGFLGLSVFGPIGLGIGFPLGIFLPVLINYSFDLNSYKLRKLNINKMQPLMSKYVSYFRFDESTFKDFPGQKIEVMEVPYNRQQYSFFLHLVEGNLPVSQLQRLLENELVRHDDEFVEINSTAIHEQIYSAIGAGRDIRHFAN